MKMLKSLLLLLAAVIAVPSLAYDCSNLPQFANGAQYATGALAKNVNHAYQCTVGGWCTIGGPYEPGVGWAWANAWSDLGACGATASSSSSVVTISSSSKSSSSIVSSKSSIAVSSTVSSTSGGSCTGLTEWSATGTYTKDTQIQSKGSKYQAKWWTQNEDPATHSSAYDVWINLGSCGGNASSSVTNVSSSKSSSKSSTSSAVTGATWSDEFDSINTSTWSFETGGGGFGNSEREYYTNGQNASIQYDAQAGSNVLVIEARKENPANYSCWYGYCEYTSARMVTSGKKAFTYGRIEARLKLPQTQGIWPAFWLLGNDIGSVGWPQCGEIDIMEHVGFEPVITHGAMHGPGYSGNTPFAGTNYLSESVSNNYHVYAVEWNSTSVKYFVDGNNFYTVNKSQVQTYGNWVYDHPMFILLNVAVGGNWPGSPDGSSTFPQRMYVDYIRVYQ